MQMDERPGMSTGLTWAFSISGGVAVANLYSAQPLLRYISQSLSIDRVEASLVVTATQLGYATGIFLIVPLGDMLNRRYLIPALMFLCSIALFATGLSPTYNIVLITLAAVGLTSVTGQLLIPLAGDLSEDLQRGRTVGKVVFGLLSGIVVCRAISGFFADAYGWRSIYFFAGSISFLLAIVLLRILPQVKVRPSVSYGKLLASVFEIIVKHRAVQVTLLLGATSFAVFAMFWTGLTFLLSSEPFSYSASEIGLIGLAGIGGAIAARRAGNFHDRGWSIAGTGIALSVVLLALAIATVGSTSIVFVVTAVVIFDVAIQTLNVLHQTRLLGIDASARSRLNTAFVTSNFIGGAIGATLSGRLWAINGWFSIATCSACLILSALIIWAFHRTRGLVMSNY